MTKWQVQEAKTHLSELIEQARSEGPQLITRHGKDQAVILSVEQYRLLTAQRPDLKTHLLGGPKVDEFTVKREREHGTHYKALTLMSGYLLDTNVLSETRKIRRNQGVTAFLSGTESDSLFISVLTIGELNKGIASKRRTDPGSADKLTSWVDSLESTFAEHVLPINSEIARIWGTLSSKRSLPVIDTLLAATAIVHGLTLVTRNTRDVKATGVLVWIPGKRKEKNFFETRVIDYQTGGALSWD